MKRILLSFVVISISFFLITNCDKKKESVVVPAIVTEPIEEVSYTSAISGGNITFNGGGEITSAGLCWGTSPNPTIYDNKVSNDNYNTNYTSNLSGLKANTTYYIRAYATNSAGTAYGNELSFKTKGTATDIDGNIYNVVSIGDQVWMVENLKVSRYNDGEPILMITENFVWEFSSSPAYCWYNNDVSNKDSYGAMYNWHAVNSHKLCPQGWHVPTNEEWETLTTYLGGLTSSAAKLKESGYAHWIGSNSDATNESKFTALPGGYRSYHNGAFFRLGENATFWSSTSNNEVEAWSRAITNYDITSVQIISNHKSYGISVRCILDK